MRALEIPLTQGQVAIVDARDWEWLHEFKWHAAKRCRTHYAASMQLRDQGYYLHRVITEAKSGEHVDHKNGNGLDNRRVNLRICTNAENRRNTRKTRGASRFKGVSPCPSCPGRPWEAYIWFENRKTHLGNYATEVEAARAYNAKALELHGEFARINEIEGLSYEESVTAPRRNRKPGRPHSRACK